MKSSSLSPDETSNAIPAGSKHKLVFCIRVLAVVTAIIGGFAGIAFVSDLHRPTQQWIITGRTLGPTGEPNYLEYHAPEYPGTDGRQERPFPAWFCNVARHGDVMLMDIGSGQTSYIMLLRNGRVVARLLNADQKAGLWFIAISFFPILSWFQWNDQRVRVAILSLSGMVEIIVIGAALVIGLFFLALRYGSVSM